MPPAKNNADDVLRRHESKIRKLYATESLETVKRIMEREPGFPKLVASTWIEKIGDLGIRKNVSSQEWRMIYLHCLCWLEDHTRKKGDLKLKRTKQDIEIVVRGRTYSWNQAWKNMRSAGAIGQLPHQGEPLGPLPPDIKIRTLSPVLVPELSTSVEGVTQLGAGASNTPAYGSPSHDGNHASQQIIFRSSYNWLSLISVSSNHYTNGSNEWTRECAKKIWIYWMGLLPIGNLVTMTVEIQNLAPPPRGRVLQRFRQGSMTDFTTESLPGPFGDAEHGHVGESQCNLIDQFLSALLRPHTTDVATTTSHKNYAKFFTVIYLLSNKFVSLSGRCPSMFKRHHDLFRELDMVFAAVPVEYLENLIRSRLVSIRAVYETLLLLTGYFKQQNAFQILIKIGFRYDWIAVPIWSHQLLYYAVSMGLDSTLYLLLDKGCRPDFGRIVYYPSDTRLPTAICEALKRKEFESVSLLLDRCDVNAPIHDTRGWWGRRQLSNFDCFLVEFDNDDEYLEHGLNLFIRAGADVNKAVVPPWGFYPPPLGILYDEPQEGRRDHTGTRGEVPSSDEETQISVMDYLFRFHRQVFHAIPPKSCLTQPALLNRASILLSLESGIQKHQQYLGSLAQLVGWRRLSRFLQLLIAEQFLGCDLAGRQRAIDLKVVRALASCSVSIAGVFCRFPNILDQFIHIIGGNSYEYAMGAIQFLLEHGAHVGGPALSLLAQLPERRLLDLALSEASSLRDLHVAITDVASKNEIQAVERLLHAGVDLSVDTIESDGNPLPISLIARLIKMSTRDSVDLPAMLEFLIKKGAVLRLSKRMPLLHHLLRFVLDHCHQSRPRTRATVEYITRTGYKDNLFLPSSLLEAAWDPAMFEYLVRYGVQLDTGSPLAACIAMGGGIGLVREMLAAGASPHAYSRRSRYLRQTPLQSAAKSLKADVVELLLEEGADVNAAAKGLGGHTALQAACSNLLHFNERDEEKLKIVQLLLARGANVNAPPARRIGRTALQETAARGDLAVAKLLLLHNPMADVNAPPCQGQQNQFRDDEFHPSELGTALDIAAGHGRLDMVKLLLSCNALSHGRGENRYDGAIYLAERRGHLVVAELIREHAKDDQRFHLRNPYLSDPPRHWSEYGYKLDLHEGSEDESESPTGTGIGMIYEADEGEPPAAVQQTHSVVNAGIEQSSEAAHEHGVKDLIQPFTNDMLPIAANLDNSAWVDQGALAIGFEGIDFSASHPTYASHQMEFGTSMDLDISFDRGIGHDVGVQYDDRMDYELNVSERLMDEVDENCE